MLFPLSAIVCMENASCRSPCTWTISVCRCLKVFQNCFSLNGDKQTSSSKDRGWEGTNQVAEVVRQIRKGNLKVLSEV